MTKLNRGEISEYFNAFDSKNHGFNKTDTDNNNVINFEEFLIWWGEYQQ